jgi:hypothetical protein
MPASQAQALTAFETRNTGVTFEVEPTLDSDGTIDLRPSPEIVTRLRLETWMEHVDQWGDGSMRMRSLKPGGAIRRST